MLILTRRPGESLIIKLPTGEQINVTVLGVKGNQVRIGTEAPDEVVILRQEVLEQRPVTGLPEQVMPPQ